MLRFRAARARMPSRCSESDPPRDRSSAKKDIEKAVASNGGNAAYKQYYWDKDIIGPKPDFAKGF